MTPNWRMFWRVVGFVGNIGLAMLWLWAFQGLGWINFEIPDWQHYLIVALITTIVLYVLGFLYFILIVVTCGLGCLLLPVYMIGVGWAMLYGGAIVTKWYTIEVEFLWYGLLMSVAYGLMRIPAVSTSSSKSGQTD